MVASFIDLYLTGGGATPPAAFRFRSPQFAKRPPGGVCDGPSSGSVIGAPKKSAPGPPPVVLCKRHGRVDFRWIICECAVKWLHSPNQPHDYTYYAAAETVGLVRAPPGPFAHFFIAMAMVVACRHQDCVDGPWRLAILRGSLSD